MKWKFFSKQKNIVLLTVLLSLIPFITILSKIWLGEFSFWYDPARDLLAGIDNLAKPTLIGPPSGIPGVFYGPYWVWLLSIPQLFSLDPRIVTLFVVTLPYMLIFPFILSRFSSTINPFVLVLLWLLFLLGFNNYFTDLWNPHLAPLLILLTIYLLFSINHSLTLRNSFVSILAGFTMGLVMNFHLSFGIGMLLGVIIYLVGENSIYLIREKRKQIILPTLLLVACFFLGIIISFAPFILFEIRHQFFQTQSLVNAFFHYGGVVTLQGLNQSEILQQFFNRPAKLTNLPVILAMIFIFIAFIKYIVSYKQRKEQIKEKEIKLLSITGCITLGVLFIYLTANNPIWEYHFIGVEILFLLVIGIFINSVAFIKKLFVLWVSILLSLSIYSLVLNIGRAHSVVSGTLIAKEKVVEKVHNESGNRDYAMFAYNPSIYMYDYSYLFKWMYRKEFSYRPELIPTNKEEVFLIIPDNTDSEKRNDFINFRTPSEQYQTNNRWIMVDGTEILKRKKI